MSRFRLRKHLLTSPVIPGVNSIILGFNIQGTNYYSPNLVDTDLAQTANDVDTGTPGYPSGAELPTANLNSRGQVVSLPGSDTAWIATFNSPEHASQVNVAWSPVGSVSAVAARSNCTVNSLNLAAGTAVVTPSHVMSDLIGWGLIFTPTGTAMTSLTAVPVGLSAGLTTNFLAEVSQMSQAGGTLRNMKRNSVEDNQGFFVYQQSSSRVTFPSSGILTAANRNVPGSPNTTSSTGQISGQPDQWNGRKSDGEPFETMIAHANAANRCLLFSTPWNCDSTYLQAFADAVCSTSVNTVYVEVANEVWNIGYRVHSQAIAEAHNRLVFLDRTGNVMIDDTTDPQSNLLTDPTTGVIIAAGNLGSGERYCEKVIQQAQILKARCTANGKPNAIKIVFCWQNVSAAYVGQMLDYIPRGSGGTATLDGTTVKANVDWVATAPYYLQGSISPHVGPDTALLSEAMKDDVDSVTTIAGSIAAAAAARGLSYMTYEGGDSVYFYPLAVACASTANTALSGGTAFPTFDGVATSSGTSVLLKNQTSTAQNGVYQVGGTSSAWTLTRLADSNGPGTGMNTWAEIWNANVYIQSGSQAGTQWMFSAAQNGTVDTTPIAITATPNSGGPTAGSESYFPTGNTTDTVAVQMSRDPIQYDCYMYWLDRLNHRLPAGSIITKYSNVAGVSGRFGAWGSLEMSTDMELSSAALKTNRPKAAAIRDFILGLRKLQNLIGSAFAATGSTVGTVVGSYKRRTFGSTPSMTGTAVLALGFVDPTAEVLQLKVIDASYFAGAGTITGNIVETDSRDPAGARSTALSVAVISTPVWSAGKSSTYFNITNGGLTGNLGGNSGVSNLIMVNQASTSLDKWFDITIDTDTGNFNIGLCAPTASPTGQVPYVFYFKGGGFVDPTDTVFASGLATLTAGDKVRIRVKNNNVFYAAKWVAGAWAWQNGSNPATDTGGYTTAGMDNTYLACVDVVGAGTQITADFSGW